MRTGSNNRLNPKCIETLYSIGVTAGLSDGQLVDRFLMGRDGANEAAFEALMERHGPMVFQVCRQILTNSHDAQDAFQATFFVLIRKAESIRKSESLASWLYGVAQRVARRAKADASRRRTHELRAAQAKLAASHAEGDQPESWAMLHEQIERMPEKYREPLVLCYLEGLTTESAAQRLGCPKGTILSRLARARERLRVGLARRKQLLPAILNGEEMHSRPTGVSISADLSEGTVQASLRFAKDPIMAATLSSSKAVALANGVLRAMITTKLKIFGAAALACAIVASSASTIARQLHTGEPTLKQGTAQSRTDKRQAVDARPVVHRKALFDERTYPGAGFSEDTTVEVGVKRFNERIKTLGVGKEEPPLTQDEVIAAIRSWDIQRFPVEQDMLKVFERVAETGVLPAGSSLDWTTRLTGTKGFAFDVWWIDLNIRAIAKDKNTRGAEGASGFTFRIRDRKLRSRPLTQQEKDRQEKDRKRFEKRRLEARPAAPK